MINDKELDKDIKLPYKIKGKKSIKINKDSYALFKLNNKSQLSSSNSKFKISKISSDNKFIIYPDYGNFLLNLSRRTIIQLKINNSIITAKNGIVAVKINEINKIKLINISGDLSYTLIKPDSKISRVDLDDLSWITITFKEDKDIISEPETITSFFDTSKVISDWEFTKKQIEQLKIWNDNGIQTKKLKKVHNIKSRGILKKFRRNKSKLTGIETVDLPHTIFKHSYVCLVNNTDIKEFNYKIKCNNDKKCENTIKEDNEICSKFTDKKTKGFIISDIKKNNEYCLQLNNNLCHKIDIKKLRAFIIELGGLKITNSKNVLIKVADKYHNINDKILLLPGRYKIRFKKNINDPLTGEKGSMFTEKRILIEPNLAKTIYSTF